MRYTGNALNVLTAYTYKGIGKAWLVKNSVGNKTAKAIVALLKQDAKDGGTITLNGFRKKSAEIEKNILKLDKFADGVVAIGDKTFPPYRGTVKNSEQPITLFYRGDLNLGLA